MKFVLLARCARKLQESVTAFGIRLHRQQMLQQPQSIENDLVVAPILVKKTWKDKIKEIFQKE